MANAKNKSRKLLWIIIMIILSGVLYAVYLETSDEHIKNKPSFGELTLEVHFIDVGQGDSIFILFGDNAVLIDAGEREYGEAVCEYIGNLGVTKLDFVIATHPHSDHIGGLPAVIGKFEVGKIIAPQVKPELTPTTKSYENFLQAVLNKGLKLTPAKAGLSYELYADNGDSDNSGDKAVLEILSPIYPQSENYTEVNDYSVVLKLTYNDITFLFTGDASKPAERDILELYGWRYVESDVLKVGHHGSNSSTTAEFLSAVSPALGIISCGAGNRYNHPNVNVINRLQAENVVIYRTDLDGDIVVYSDGLGFTIDYK